MILFVLEYFWPRCGGVEALFGGIVEKLYRDHGIRSAVVTSCHEPYLPLLEHHDRGSIWRYKGSRKTFGLTVLRSLVHNPERTQNVTCVYTSTFVAGFIGWIIAQYLKKPCILTVHELFGSGWEIIKPGFMGQVFKRAEKLLLRLPFTHYHVVSHASATTLISRVPSIAFKHSVVYNAIDYDARNDTIIGTEMRKQLSAMYCLDGKKIFMYVGHCGRSKGIDILLDAWEQRSPHHPDTILICNLLPSDARNATHARILSGPTKNQIITFLGMTKNELLAKVCLADCIIIPSRSEGFGIFAAEASALKKDLIVARTSALPEVVSGNIRRFECGSSSSLITKLDARYQQQGPDEIIPPRHFPWSHTIQGVKQIIDHVTSCP
ncbi:MAG: glycosyltransferase family 4 protein [Candidatus Absconditabacterales bacterium]|nr:glycosyltransferase family 4 protein [Candidatus Absconditabacterales bacterium]